MRLLFVMDLLNGMVVHAERGERAKYQPIHLFSSIVHTSVPSQVMEEVRPAAVYIADLNRLMGTGSNMEILRELRDRYRGVWIALDCGVRSLVDIEDATGIADSIILGTETASLALIREAAERWSASASIAVSIDLFNKKVQTSDRRMRIEPLDLIMELNSHQIQDVIILELDRVGTGRGVDFDFLARSVERSEHDILCGGGVRSCEDLYKMEDIGVKGALLATAVHNGTIPVSYLRPPSIKNF